MKEKKRALIIGAGPAGLTAAYELLKQTDYSVIVCEIEPIVGGLSRTEVYKNNRIDIGGHRFFSKSQKVMNWWLSFLPLQGAPAFDDILENRFVPLSTADRAPDPASTDRVMLSRSRVSRIMYMRRFFLYPVSASIETIKSFGLRKTTRVGLSYLRAHLFPVKVEKTLADYIINRFGRELYKTFFENYTLKVWGVPCDQIPAEWGSQRIKGLSILSAIKHAIRRKNPVDNTIEQKGIEQTLINRFLYPKLGPGQLWESVAKNCREMGCTINLRTKAVGIHYTGNQVTEVILESVDTGARQTIAVDTVFSSMPIKELISSMEPAVPKAISSVSDGLLYRDFFTAGLLLKKLLITDNTRKSPPDHLVRDNWIYVQEPDVHVGRIQFFNNWSPYLVENPQNVWLGLEYFCSETDALWRKTDEEIIMMATEELCRLGIADANDVLDGVVVRAPKAYPAYFGSYSDFDIVKKFADTFTNLFLIGRNGMHRYNNADHSMLSAMAAVDALKAGDGNKDGIWAVNNEQTHHEEN